MDEEFEHLFNIRKLRVSIKGRTIRKVMGGGGWGNCQEKKSCKEESKEKIHAEERSSCDFFRKSEFQKSTILPGTI